MMMIFYEEHDVFVCDLMQVKWLSKKKVFCPLELKVYWMKIKLRSYLSSTK